MNGLSVHTSNTKISERTKRQRGCGKARGVLGNPHGPKPFTAAARLLAPGDL
jgi:hypothetical protein